MDLDNRQVDSRQDECSHTQTNSCELRISLIITNPDGRCQWMRCQLLTPGLGPASVGSLY